jgi:hypothetical protein
LVDQSFLTVDVVVAVPQMSVRQELAREIQTAIG